MHSQLDFELPGACLSTGAISTSCSLPDSPERHRYFGRSNKVQESRRSHVSSLLHRQRVRRDELGKDEVDDVATPIKTDPSRPCSAGSTPQKEPGDTRPFIPVFDFSASVADTLGAASSPAVSYCTPSWFVLARCAVDVIDLSEQTKQYMILLPDSVLYVSSTVELPAMLYCKLLIRAKRKGLPEPGIENLQGLSPSCSSPLASSIASRNQSRRNFDCYTEVLPSQGPLFPPCSRSADGQKERGANRTASIAKVGPLHDNADGLDEEGVSSGDDDDPTPRVPFDPCEPNSPPISSRTQVVPVQAPAAPPRQHKQAQAKSELTHQDLGSCMSTSSEQSLHDQQLTGAQTPSPSCCSLM